jgi:hypothetical protein
MFGKVHCGLNFDKLALQFWNLHPGTQVKRVFMLAFPPTSCRYIPRLKPKK